MGNSTRANVREIYSWEVETRATSRGGDPMLIPGNLKQPPAMVRRWFGFTVMVAWAVRLYVPVAADGCALRPLIEKGALNPGCMLLFAR
jgi:hypothetical protein